MIKKVKALQKELKETEVEATSKDGSIAITFNGELRMTGFKVSDEWMTSGKTREFEKEVLNVAGQAISRAQAVAAEQMKQLQGIVNLPAGL